MAFSNKKIRRLFKWSSAKKGAGGCEWNGQSEPISLRHERRPRSLSAWRNWWRSFCRVLEAAQILRRIETGSSSRSRATRPHYSATCWLYGPTLREWKEGKGHAKYAHGQ